MLDNKTGLYKSAKGGTEQMAERLNEFLTDDLKDKFQIICSRVRDLEKNKKKILWLHDCFNDPESAHLSNELSRNRFSKLVFVSNFQFQTYHAYLGVPYSQSTVIKNGIELFDRRIVKDQNKIRLIYHTTPHRGLEILIPVFLELCKEFSNIHLDVYSSFEIYGWEERNKPYETLFDICKNHPQITYHGTQPNNVVREALRNSHIFAFPSIWPETSCLAAIEAMAEECLVVCPNFAALSETVGKYGFLYDFDENKNIHAQKFYNNLRFAIENIQSDKIRNILTHAKVRVSYEYDWGRLKYEWLAMLEDL